MGGCFDDGEYWIEGKPGVWTGISVPLYERCFLHGALRDDWRAVLLQSWYGWMIRVLEEGYRLSKMDELNGKVFVLRSTVDKVLGHSRIEI